MNPIAAAVLGLFAVVLMSASPVGTTQPSDAIAVVELFTSEGCSSCPPADELLAEIAREPRVLALSFHVDYWNRLGWRDPFSDAIYSQRQQQYAAAFHYDEIYTPQMIVNGRSAFVGSDRAAANRAIDQACSSAAPVRVSLSLQSSADGNNFDATCSTSGLTKPAILNVALVESGLSSDVRRGENAGRKLRHENVVRWFHTSSIEPNESGQLTIPRISFVRPDHAAVICFLQRTEDMSVLGATSIALPK